VCIIDNFKIFRGPLAVEPKDTLQFGEGNSELEKLSSLKAGKKDIATRRGKSERRKKSEGKAIQQKHF